MRRDWLAVISIMAAEWTDSSCVNYTSPFHLCIMHDCTQTDFGRVCFHLRHLNKSLLQQCRRLLSLPSPPYLTVVQHNVVMCDTNVGQHLLVMYLRINCALLTLEMRPFLLAKMQKKNIFQHWMLRLSHCSCAPAMILLAEEECETILEVLLLYSVNSWNCCYWNLQILLHYGTRGIDCGNDRYLPVTWTYLLLVITFTIYFPLSFNQPSFPELLQVRPVPEINFWELREQAFYKQDVLLVACLIVLRHLKTHLYIPVSKVIFIAS